MDKQELLIELSNLLVKWQRASRPGSELTLEQAVRNTGRQEALGECMMDLASLMDAATSEA